mmetsp:Transcript_7600/g.12432  ORF Transcript_7600/g.12432 Transcript_7600/m.12432 type:complete len:211 (-) Transcript_7600:361-993(-)
MRAEIIRFIHHSRRGDIIRILWNVRRLAYFRFRKLHPDHHSAVHGRTHRIVVGRSVTERLRNGLWYLVVHRHQHLREHHLESLLANHHQLGWRPRIRRRHHCILLSLDYTQQQVQRIEGSILSQELAEFDQLDGDDHRVSGGDLCAGLPSGSAIETRESARNLQSNVSDQAVLYIQHSGDLADCVGVQLVLLLAITASTIFQELLCALVR